MDQTASPPADQLEDLYHKSRGAIHVGDTTQLLEELMAAARAEPDADEVIVAIGLSGVGWIRRVDYWTRCAWEEKDTPPIWADFALVIEGSHFCSYTDLWEQTEPQLLNMIEQTRKKTPE